jgi:hypothetical protein
MVIVNGKLFEYLQILMLLLPMIDIPVASLLSRVLIRFFIHNAAVLSEILVQKRVLTILFPRKKEMQGYEIIFIFVKKSNRLWYFSAASVTLPAQGPVIIKRLFFTP